MSSWYVYSDVYPYGTRVCLHIGVGFVVFILLVGIAKPLSSVETRNSTLFLYVYMPYELTQGRKPKIRNRVGKYSLI